jgi:predicted metal-dependent hydrolase
MIVWRNISYSKHELQYRVRYSPRRTLAITVHPNGRIEVVAPRGTSPKEVETRVRKRARWIVRQRLYFEQFHPRSKTRRYVGGETHLYLGRQYRLKLVKGDYDEVKLKRGLLVVTSRGPQKVRRVKELISAWYQTEAKARFAERYWRIARRFTRLGYRISPPQVRRMSRRWGSYSKSGRVLLNPDLVRASTACIDYVITHELAHTVYSDHSTKFFELLERMMPDWRRRKDRLERTLA